MRVGGPGADEINRCRKADYLIVVVVEEFHVLGKACRRSVDPIIGMARFRLVGNAVVHENGNP